MNNIADTPTVNIQKYFCLQKDPILTREGLSIVKLESCQNQIMVITKELLWGMSSGYRVCLDGKKFRVLRVSRCPVSMGDLYLYRTNSSTDSLKLLQFMVPIQRNVRCF